MSEGFAIIPNWLIRDTNVSVHALAVYAVLSSRADKTGVCWPSIPTIAKEARTSDGTVKKALQELADVGVLSWSTRKQGSRNLSNLYRLNMSVAPPEGVGQEVTHPGGDPGVGQEVTQGGSPDDREEEPLKKNQRRRTTLLSLDGEKDARVVSGLARVWESWPSARRSTHKVVDAKWAAAVKTVGLGDLDRLVRVGVAFGERYSSWPESEWKFVPLLSTWLHQERWTTPLPEVARSDDQVASGVEQWQLR